jgi:hypothetical protein
VTRRDLAWRAGGLVLFAPACALGFADRVAPGGSSGAGDTIWGLLRFALAIIGLLLLVQGRRVAKAWHVERGRHRNLVAVIHARRIRRVAAGDPIARR